MWVYKNKLVYNKRPWLKKYAQDLARVKKNVHSIICFEKKKFHEFCHIPTEFSIILIKLFVTLFCYIGC